MVSSGPISKGSEGTFVMIISIEPLQSDYSRALQIPAWLKRTVLKVSIKGVRENPKEEAVPKIADSRARGQSLRRHNYCALVVYVDCCFLCYSVHI